MLEVKKFTDILNYCLKNNINTKDFNEPVKILDGANCKDLFSHLTSFNQDVIIPEYVLCYDLSNMFSNCHSFNSKVIFKSDKNFKYYNMSRMFNNCCSLEKIDLDISMQNYAIFRDCYNLKEVTLRIHTDSFDYIYPSEFKNCVNLKKINCDSEIRDKELLESSMLYGLIDKEITYSQKFLESFSSSLNEDIAIGFYNEKDNSLFNLNLFYTMMPTNMWSKLFKYIDRPAIVRTVKTEMQTRWENEYIPCIYIKVSPEEYAEELLLHTLGENE